MRQLDWNKAREICEQNRGHKVDAGLDEDWFWTGGEIFDGENYISGDFPPYVASTWATPVLRVETDMGWMTIPCFMEGGNSEMPDWWTE